MSKGVKRRRISEDGAFQAERPQPTAQEMENDAPKELPISTDNDQRRTLFVRSLPSTVNKDRLADFFSESYPLKHATVVLDPKTKESKGYGFVTFTDAEDAQKAVVALQNAKLDGRKIKLELADSRDREIAVGSGKSRPSAKALEQKQSRPGNARTDQQPPKLIVRNLPWSIKEPEDLAVLFRSYGKVKEAIVPKVGTKGQAGFGFVILRGRKNAEKAMATLNGKVVDGRTLAVDWAVDRETWEKAQGEEGEQVLAEGESDAVATENMGPEIGVDGGETDQPADSRDGDVSMSDGLGSDIDSEDFQAGADDNESSEEDMDEAPSTSIFVRNLPFSTTDESLSSHFAQYAPVRYARIVVDPVTERPKGTGFVCFFKGEDARDCVKNAPRDTTSPANPGDKKRKDDILTHSVLQNETTDPSGRYTILGRIVNVSKALSKSAATKKSDESASSRQDARERDKRRLFLLSEGTISSGTALYESLSQAEINIREASSKQRQKMTKTNPSLHVSLTRLSIRNLPRHITSTALKALAREAVVGFATEVKQGQRQPLSKEELQRNAAAMKEAESLRKQRGKGIVRQAKIVFEGREGGKVTEKSGGGRSRGYGFIEYVSHRSALMGLRWLNGHGLRSADGGKMMRLIVEFAIENAQVVSRRDERITKSRLPNGGRVREQETSQRRVEAVSQDMGQDKGQEKGKKRKRSGKENRDVGKKPAATQSEPEPIVDSEEKNKIAKRNRIIARKRGMRKARKG